MSIKRKVSIGLLAILAMVASFVCRPTYAQALADDSQPTVETIKPRGELFAQFIFGETAEFGVQPRPFVYPIIGPTGAAMTRNFPMREGVDNEATDHPHHTSLWFTHGNVNGIDFWTRGAGKGVIRATRVERSDRLSNNSAGPEAVDAVIDIIESHEEWIAPDGVKLIDGVSTLTFSQDGYRYIDCHYSLVPAAGVEKVTFGDTKEGTMAIRTHPALRLKGPVATGHCVNSEGHTDGACWGKRAKWVAYWGVIDGKTCGIAVFDHPTNLRHPTWWHARDYGLIAANPFGIHDFEKGQPRGAGDYTLEAGQTLSLRYRFVFFAGTAEEANIAGHYEAWVAETTEQLEDNNETE